MSKDFYLIYVDEYGNTGDKLDTPDQPYYMLQAAFVKPGENWLNLESGLLDVSLALQERMGLKYTPPLHMVELYQRSGFYTSPPPDIEPLGVGESFEYLDRVFRLMDTYGVKFVTYGVDKLRLIKAARRKESNARPRKKIPRFRQMTFLVFLTAIDEILRGIDAYGTVFFEQERSDIDNQISSSAAYAAMRKQGLLTRVLGSPLYRSKRSCPLLAVADFGGYVTGSAILVERFGRKERPRLSEWFNKYVLPNSMRHYEGGAKKQGHSEKKVLVSQFSFMAAFHSLSIEPDTDIATALRKFREAEELAESYLAKKKEGGEDAP